MQIVKIMKIITIIKITKFCNFELYGIPEGCVTIWAYEFSNLVWFCKRSISWKKVVALMYVKQCFLAIRTSSNASLREMRLEFMPTTLKQPTNQANIVLKAKPKRARQSRSKIKVMMTVFFSIFVVWCTMNSLLAKLLIRNII